MTSARLLQLADGDNVYIATGLLHEGDSPEIGESRLRVRQDVELGHKVAACAIDAGEPVVRAGMAIGLASAPIAAGDWVHTHNLVSSYIRTFDHRGGEDGADA